MTFLSGTVKYKTLKYNAGAMTKRVILSTPSGTGKSEYMGIKQYPVEDDTSEGEKKGREILIEER